MKESVTLHLVEVSPTLADIQQKKLTGTAGSGSISSDTISGPFGSNEPHCYKSCKSKYGPEVFWYRALSDVPREKVSGFIAHEFFDALPIHKFQVSVFVRYIIFFIPFSNSDKNIQYFVCPSICLSYIVL